MKKKIDQKIIHFSTVENLPYREIKKRLNVGNNRIKQVLDAFSKGKEVDHIIGRPRVCDDRIKTFIEIETLKNAMLPSRHLKQLIKKDFDMEMSTSTINRVRNSLLFRWKPPRIKQSLSEAQKSIRYQFCKDFQEKLEHLPIYFSDECRFEQKADSSWRWIRRGDYNESSFSPISKSSTSVMIWAAIGYEFKSQLVIIEKNINSDEYTQIVTNNGFIEEANRKHGLFGWFFQQDGAPSHGSKNTFEKLSNQINILPGWPPNSPDLNPIELLWGIMKNILKKKEISTKEAFVKAIHEIWDAIPLKTINNLVVSFDRRIQFCIDCGGESIQAFVRNNLVQIPDEYLASDEKIPKLWTDEEDQRILSQVNQIGHKWKEISGLFPNRSPNEVKNRYFSTIMRSKVKGKRYLIPPVDDFLNLLEEY